MLALLSPSHRDVVLQQYVDLVLQQFVDLVIKRLVDLVLKTNVDLVIKQFVDLVLKQFLDPALCMPRPRIHKQNAPLYCLPVCSSYITDIFAGSKTIDISDGCENDGCLRPPPCSTSCAACGPLAASPATRSAELAARRLRPMPACMGATRKNMHI